jgi:hypothetical protein
MPITRTDEDDFIIFDEEHVGSSLRNFLCDLGRKWVELDVMRYNIADRLWMYSCSAVRVRRGAGATAGGALTCAIAFSPAAHKALNAPSAAATARKVELRSRRVM